MSDTAIAATAAVSPPPPSSSSAHLWHNGSFSFRDLLDIINPLQHLPVIGSLYRWITGDEPGAMSRIVGDTLYGGPIGFGVSALSVISEDAQGHDLGEQVLAAAFGPFDRATERRQAGDRARLVRSRAPTRADRHPAAARPFDGASADPALSRDAARHPRCGTRSGFGRAALPRAASRKAAPDCRRQRRK